MVTEPKVWEQFESAALRIAMLEDRVARLEAAVLLSIGRPAGRFELQKNGD